MGLTLLNQSGRRCFIRPEARAWQHSPATWMSLGSRTPSVGHPAEGAHGAWELLHRHFG